MRSDEHQDGLEKLDIPGAAEVGTACHKMMELCLKAGHSFNTELVRGTTITVTSGEHAALGPSSAERWSVCPGSVVMVKKVAESAGRVVTVEVQPEMVVWVNTVVTWVLDYLHANPGSTLFVEERARAGVPFGCPDDMWGTADVVIVNRLKRELVVLDGKFGYVEVKAWRNPQLLLYAIGIAHDFGWAFDRYRLIIAQPRSDVPFKEHALNATELQEEMERLRPKVKDAVDQLHHRAPLKLVPTEDGCLWCEAAGACPEFQKRALDLARREFFEPELLPRDQLVLLLKKADSVRSALNAAEAHAARLLALGQKVDGFKLVRGTKRTVWRDEKAAGDALQKLGVPAGEVWKSEMQFTPAQAKKKVGKRFEDMLDAYAHKPEGEPTLVSEDDPRMPLPPEFEPC